MNAFSIKPAYALEEIPEEKKWLIEHLWTEQSVGIIGGEPKCCKSFLALSLALSVASGKPCLNKFHVQNEGRVLLYAAEDATHILKSRLESMSKALGLSLRKIPLFVIISPSIRLDLENDRKRLEATLEKVKPKFLILDPFVRLHRIDENVSGEVAPILAHLRKWQRSLKISIALVHHAGKAGSKKRPGQALRGSSEFHAWGDTNLYMKRKSEEELLLSVEHRSEKAISPISLALVEEDKSISLQIQTDSHTKEQISSEQKILNIISNSKTPLGFDEIRSFIKMRTTTVYDILSKLVFDKKITKINKLYSLIPSS